MGKESSLQIISRPLQRWVIDRFEESWAVLQNSETLETISLPRASLPQGARAGDTLVKQGSKWHKDDAETAARAKRVSERFERIKQANKPPLT